MTDITVDDFRVPGAAPTLEDELVDFPSAAPVPQFQQDIERVAAEKAIEERSLTFDDVGASFRDSSYTGQIFGAIVDSKKFVPDLDYRMSDEMFASVTEGLPEDTWDTFRAAGSDEHAVYLRNRVLDYLDRRKQIGELGWTGVGLDIVTGIVDPVALAADVATLGTTKLFTAGKVTTRVGQAVADGLAVGLTNAGLEGTVGTLRPDHTTSDTLWAAGLGMALGGGIGFLRGGVSHNALQAKLGTQLSRTVEMEAAEQAGLTVTDAGRKYASIGGKKSLSDVLDGDTDADIVDALTVAERNKAAGAQGNPFMSEPLSREADEAARIAEGENITASIARGRIDMTGQLVTSKNPLIRRLGVTLAEDAVGLAGRETPIGASEEAMRGWRTSMSEYHRASNPNFRKWLTDYDAATVTKARLTNPGKEREFQRLVTEATVRLDNAEALKAYHPAVVDTARVNSKIYADLLAHGQRMGVTNFENIAFSKTYVPRLADRGQIAALVKRFGKTQLERVIANAILRGSDDLLPESAEKIAKQWLKTHLELHVGLKDALRSTVRGAEDLRDMLVDTLTFEKDIDPATARDEVEAMVAFRKSKGDGAMSRAKRRVQMDETYSEELLDSATQMPTQFRLSDMFNRDADRLLSLYSRQINGHAAMAKRGFPDEGAFKAELDRARKVAMDYDQDVSKLDHELEIAETLYKSVVGRPLADYTKGWNRWARRFMDLQYIRVMNQVGFAQIPEMGNLMGQVGWRTVLDQIPAIKSFFARSLKDGKIADETQMELETIWGFGTDNLRAHFGNRIDDAGEMDTFGKNGLDNLLDQGKYITTHISGFNAINQMSHRWAVRAIAAKFAQAAFDVGKPISAKRLGTLGMTPELTERVYGQIRTHAVTGEGFLTGRKMHKINLDAWDDRDAADAFVGGVDRWVRRAIQNNDIGNLHIWLTKPIVQVFTQFRTFMIVSYTKQVLHGINMRDFETVMSYVYSTMLAGLSYVGQTYVRAQFRSDKEEYLKERLSFQNIALSAWQRAGWSTFFPMAYDTAADMAGFDQLFSYGRTTGLASGLVGAPVVDFFDRAKNTVRDISQGVQGENAFTQDELYRATQLLPFSNALIVQNLLRKLSENSGLPEND